MAATIRIKRSGTSGNPATLAQGELAYSYLADNGSNGGDRLYVGTGVETLGDAANHTVVGGKHYVDLLHGEGDPNYGTLTASAAIIVDTNKKINELLVDNITLDGNTISTSSGNLIFSPTGYVDANSNLIKNVTTPVDSADAATKDYVDQQIVTGVSFTISDGSITDTFNAATGTLTFNGGTGITTTVSDDQVSFAITNTGVSAGSYGSTTAVPVITINAQGQITNASTASISTDLTFNGDNINLLNSDLTITEGQGIDVSYDSATNTLTTSLVNTSLTVTAGDGLTGGGSISLGDSATLDVNVDDSTIEIVADALQIKDGGVTNAKLANDSITIGTTSVALGASTTTLDGLTQIDVDNIRILDNTIASSSGVLYIDPNPIDSDGGDVIVRGNLTVQGTQTVINSTAVSINDLNIILADSAVNAAAADGAGITVNGANATITYDAVDDWWEFNKDVNISGGSLYINGTEFSSAVDSSVADLLQEGEGIDLTYNSGAGTLTVSAELATINNRGVASFDSDQFSVTSGAVTIYQLDGGTY